MRPRDLVVSVFLEQGHPVRADELSELVRVRQPGVARATVYRALRWMVDARVAKKIDGSGSGAHFAQTLRRVTPSTDARRLGDLTNLVIARDALRLAVATSAAARAFYDAVAHATAHARLRAASHRFAEEAHAHLTELEEQLQVLLVGHPDLVTSPTALFFKGSATSLFAAGIQEVTPGTEPRAALIVAIRCARRSHRFFSREAQRLEDPTARAVFLGSAEVAQGHLDALVQEYRAVSGTRTRRLSLRPFSAPDHGRRLRGRP